MNYRTMRQGFSLIEIIIAVAIMAIMALVVVPNLMQYVSNSRKDATTANVRAFETAINMFNVHTGQLPARLQDLVKKPADERVARKWQGPYLLQREIPEDAWGNRFQYKVTPQGEHKYELYSYGPDGKGSPKAEWINVWDL